MQVLAVPSPTARRSPCSVTPLKGFGSANLATNVTNDGTLTLNSEDSGDYAQIYSESSGTEFTNDGTFDTTATTAAMTSSTP